MGGGDRSVKRADRLDIAQVLPNSKIPGTVRLWDVVPTHSHRRTSPRPHIKCKRCSVSHEGRLLACGNSDNTARLWDVASHRPVGKPLIGRGGSVYCVSSSPNEKY